MSQVDNFLHTTHRTVSWFKKAFVNDELILAAPFQRNPVWTDLQKAYLIDTILNGLPIPELYMQDIGDESGEEKHIVVDGQQRIRAVLEFVQGDYALRGEEVTRKWRGFLFEDLTQDEKKAVFGYKFVVRVLPAMDDEGIRRIFARLNRNVVALNEQELRNATYWGPFMQTVKQIADEDPFWADSGLFSANDHRRMIDHEYISELAIAILHGPQNKKDKLDHYYQLYEETFDDRDILMYKMRNITSEISRLLPELRRTRWRKKSDFYTLFLELAPLSNAFPWPSNKREEVSQRLNEFARRVDEVLRLEEGEATDQDEYVLSYARNVARAASDRVNRIARGAALSNFALQNKAELPPPEA